MEEIFKITVEIEGQSVKADCRVELGRFLYLTMTAPYHGVKTGICTRDEEDNIRQFYNRQEAEDYALRELVSILAYVKQVKQHRNEYAEASHFFKQRYSAAMTEFRATEASRKRGCLAIQSKITQKVLDEYEELICRLIPTVDKQSIIQPDLLAQILTAI